MSPRFPDRKFLINWVKALLLSPGILFPAAYLMVYLATGLYLNADFKMNLSRSINLASGNTWQISIKSLKPSLILDSVTLDHIKLTPTDQLQNNEPDTLHAITIKTLEIPWPGLEKVLFSRNERLSSTNTVCKKILADERLAQ
jgi:hypothetical protein